MEAMEESKKGKRFVECLSNYLVDYELSEIDKRMIYNMFLRHQETIYVKKYVSQRKRTIVSDIFVSRQDMRRVVKPNMNPAIIIKYVADIFRLPDFNINITREGRYPDARFMAMLLMDKCTHLTLVEIGSHFKSTNKKTGHLDHTSVIHGISAATDLCETVGHYRDIFYDFLTIHNIEINEPNNSNGIPSERSTGNPVVS